MERVGPRARPRRLWRRRSRAPAGARGGEGMPGAALRHPRAPGVAVCAASRPPAAARRARVSPEGFLADVLSAPERLERTLDGYAGEGSPLRALATVEPERVLLIGMGSSHFAAQTAATHLRARGVDAVAELASTGLPTPPRAGTLAVGISASGRTAETVEALGRHGGIATTVAVTNTPDSDIGET